MESDMGIRVVTITLTAQLLHTGIERRVSYPFLHERERVSARRKNEELTNTHTRFSHSSTVFVLRYSHGYFVQVYCMLYDVTLFHVV